MKNFELDNNQIRQGDVFLLYIDKPETEPKIVEPGQCVILAHGESTGHTHALRSDAPITSPPSKPVFDAAAERYIKMLFKGRLAHEEHFLTDHPEALADGSTPVRTGTIEIGVQVEAGPHNMLRRVED